MARMRHLSAASAASSRHCTGHRDNSVIDRHLWPGQATDIVESDSLLCWRRRGVRHLHVAAMEVRGETPQQPAT
eukprot:scaffold60756_cov35-Tisochrysis_lutea.AAC.3